jgi:hypothetical protein
MTLRGASPPAGQFDEVLADLDSPGNPANRHDATTTP